MHLIVPMRAKVTECREHECCRNSLRPGGCVEVEGEDNIGIESQEVKQWIEGD
jgi:hypothetical protein